MHLKMASAKWRPFCFGLNVLKVNGLPALPADGHTTGDMDIAQSPGFMTI